MMTTWQHGRQARDARIEAGGRLARGKIVEARDATSLLEAVVRPGDRVCLEAVEAGYRELEDAARRLREAGASVRDVTLPPPFAGLVDAQIAIMVHEVANTHMAIGGY